MKTRELLREGGEKETVCARYSAQIVCVEREGKRSVKNI